MGLLSKALIALRLKKATPIPRGKDMGTLYFEPDACEHVARKHAEAKKARHRLAVQEAKRSVAHRSRAADDFFSPVNLSPSFDSPSFTANSLFDSAPSLPAFSGGGGGFDGGGSSGDWSPSSDYDSSDSGGDSGGGGD